MSPTEEELEQYWLTLSNYLIGNWTTQTISAAVKLGVIDALTKTPLSVKELAYTLDLNRRACHRLLRALVGLKIVEHSSGTFTLTEMGHLLSTEHKWSLAAPSILWADEHYTAWGELDFVLKTGHPSFDKIYGESYFDWLTNDPTKRRLYHEALMRYANYDYRDLAELYDFSQHQIIMDVGGGSGSLLVSILLSYPLIYGILLERLEVIELAEKTLANAGLNGRYEVISANFLNPIPKKADLIVLAKVLHDWDDTKAQIILENCYQALSEKGRILIVEIVLPEQLGSSFGALLSLNMLVMTGGQERSLAGYKTLLQGAKFEVIQVIQTSSRYSVIIAEKHRKNLN